MMTELGMTITSSAPKATPEQVKRLIAELRKAKKRLLAAELAQIMFGKTTETAKRRVRVIAKAAKPRVVSFPGSDGFDLWARCPIPELWRCIDEMEAAMASIAKDILAYRRALHSGYRGEPGDAGQGEFAELEPAPTSKEGAA